MMFILQKLKNISKIDYINYLILLYAFLLSFPVALKTPVLVAMILLWLSNFSEQRVSPREIKRIFISLILLALLFLFSSFYSDASLLNILIYIKKFWYFLPIFIIYGYLKEEYLPYAITLFLLGMFVSEILSYGVLFSFWKIRFSSPSNPSVFLHHIQYSIFLSLTSIILFFRGLSQKKVSSRLIYFIFFTTVTLNLFVNVGRTGYITFLAGMILSIFFIYKPKPKMIIVGFLAIFAIIFLAYTISPNFKTRVYSGISDVKKLDKNNFYDTSIGARVALLITAKEIFLKNPIFGVGVADHLNKKDQFALSVGNDRFRFLTKIAHFHNSFLEILTQLGLVGLFVFIYILYSIATIKIEDKSFRAIKISLITIFVLGSFTDRLFHLNSTMSLFAFMTALVLLKHRFETD